MVSVTALFVRKQHSPAPATVGQLPMLVLMIGYTTLGLWLLSTPSVG